MPMQILLMRLLIFLSFLPVTGIAMNLEEVFDEARKRNESISWQEESVVQADEGYKQAIGSIAPTLNFTTQYFWQQKAPTSNNSFSPPYQPLTKLTASQPIFQGFREWKGLTLSKSLLSQQRMTKESVQLTLYKNVVAGYYNIISLERDMLNLKEESGFLVDRIKELEHRQRIGRGQAVDVLTAKSQLATLNVQLEKDSVGLEMARDAFGFLTGLPADTLLVDDAGPTTPVLQALPSYLDRIQSRPDVRASKEGLNGAELGIDLAKANHLPSVGLQYDRYLLRSGMTKDVEWDASVVLTIPIFAGGVTQSKVRQAYSVTRQAQLTLSQAERNAADEVRTLHDQVRSDLKQRDLNRENLQLSEAAFREEQRSYRLGLVTNLDVLTSLNTFIEAKRSLDTNRYALKADFLKLQAAVGIR
jgi:outer membrane protein